MVMIFLIVLLVMALAPFVIISISSADRIQTIEEVEPHEVAIVYGAGLFSGRPSPYLAARLEIARSLFFAEKVQVILVSGDNLYPEHNEPDAMVQWLVDRGVPRDKIVADYAGEDTYATCVRAREIFGVTSAILVSQTYHLPRAVTTCRLVGVDAIGVGDDTMKAYNPDSWRRYSLREILADYNMVFEVLTGRTPILGPYETSVDDALNR
jgi:vancomycin permeability regulator SanA